MKNVKQRALIRLVAFLLIFIFVGGAPVFAQKKTPNFWLSNIEGKRFSTKTQKTPYLISFFFIGCVPCIKEIPELHRMITKEFPQIPLLFIDPLKTDDASKIKEFADKLGVPLSLFYSDAFGTVGKKFFEGEMKFPTIVGVKKHKILFRFLGLPPGNIAKIREFLKNKS
ncbi:TlpA disulfide reductase family protein [Deltaproteobacteria bacterium TL4]